MTDIIEPVKEHIVVVDGFLPLVNSLAAVIDKNNISENRVPVGMAFESFGGKPQCSRAKTVIGVEDNDYPTLGS